MNLRRPEFINLLGRVAAAWPLAGSVAAAWPLAAHAQPTQEMTAGPKIEMVRVKHIDPAAPRPSLPIKR
jgi:hypothetical protein